MKKEYLSPAISVSKADLCEELLGASAPQPDVNIGDGGEGKDEDDPNSKRRDNDGWGNLW